MEILKNGILLEVAPGGLREQNFSDENLSLVWGNHTGFAQVALEAKVVSVEFVESAIPLQLC